MMRLGSLCSGIGGLDMAVCEVFGAVPVWFSEIDPHASTVLERHYPHVPNLGDLHRVGGDPGTPCVDIICAGYP